MKFKKVLAVFLAVAALAAAIPFAPLTARAEEAEVRTIRVGYFAFPGYHIMDEEGKRSGYGYEFLQLLARHKPWRYEYIGYDGSYDDALGLLDEGKVDLVTSVSKTAEREEKYYFSEKDIGTNTTIFTVKAGNRKVKKGDYTTYNGLTVGMLKENSKNANFEEFAEGKFTYTPKYYESDTLLSAALEGGEVDGIVTGSLRAMGDEWLIESLAPSPFYVCTKKNAQGGALMEEIDAVIETLDTQKSDWRSTLQNKYYATDKTGDIILTSEERAYLDGLTRSGEKLKVLMNPDRKPYSYFENGVAGGIFPALFEKMTEGLSLSVEYIETGSRKEYFDRRKQGDADIVLDFGDDLYSAEVDGYNVSETYFSTTHTLIKRNDLKGEIKRVALVSYTDDLFAADIKQYFGSAAVREFDTMRESVEAVKRGECDATLSFSYAAELFLWEDGGRKLSSELIGQSTNNYTIGVYNGAEGYLLLSVLNKCVMGLDRSAVSSIVTEEVTKFRPEVTVNAITFLRRNPGYIALIVAAVFLILFFVAMLVIRTLNQRKLQEKVVSATAQLEAQKEELSTALHAADAANRSKTTFLNSMSHDIRTPMNAIIGFTALATTHLDDKERALDYLGKISQASTHLLSLINDVLDMSRIEAGKVQIEERPENLADILQGLRNIIQSDINAKRLELFIDTVDVVNEEIYCDKLRMNQILLNLTSNAIKFTKSGGSVAIKVTQKPSRKEGCGTYEFCVSDTGIGMSPEFLETVFEPFTRERNSTVSGIQGTGLGMAITKNIVDMMGGTISVESEQGKGTKFTVSVDFRFADGGNGDFTLTELKGLYALVVDDDLVSCQSVSKMLRQIGMHADWTVTGKEAVVRTSEAIELGNPFEVYIIDWAMPDMDGITTVRKIRAIIGDESPIILMSAYDWADIEEDARAAGVTGFLSKPLFASDLHRALERCLGKAPETKEEIGTLPSFAGRRLLLAEDNELNREIAEEILQEAGFEVESAENGKVACEMAERAESGYYDLILMDIQMPVMNGYDATKYIRSLGDKALADIPIIAMTANAFEEDRAKAYSVGMSGHLAKPIDTRAMLELLDAVLDGKPSK